MWTAPAMERHRRVAASTLNSRVQLALYMQRKAAHHHLVIEANVHNRVCHLVYKNALRLVGVAGQAQHVFLRTAARRPGLVSPIASRCFCNTQHVAQQLSDTWRRKIASIVSLMHNQALEHLQAASKYRIPGTADIATIEHKLLSPCTFPLSTSAVPVTAAPSHNT
jgi:hypothetical protein